MMKIIFWFLIGITFFIYFLFPVIIFLIAETMGRKPKRRDITPSVSLIIAFHNEEKVVRHKIKSVLSLVYPRNKLEIIFALDGCTDRTKYIVSRHGAGRIKILDNAKRIGKVATLNKAVLKAKGEIIVFSDANSMHGSDLLQKLVRNFTDKNVGCVSGRLSYAETDATAVGKGENLYWRYEHFLKTQESRLGRLLITNGSIQAVRRHLYPYPDPEVADDFSIPLLVQSKGYKILYEPEAVVFEVATKNFKEEFNQKVRIVSQGLKGAIRLRKDLLKLGPLGIFELLFHKVLRWFIPFFLIGIFFLNLLSLKNTFYFYLFMIQVTFYLFALVGSAFKYRSKIRLFYVPFYFCLVNYASLAAFSKLLNGGETRMWDKAHTTRSNR